MAIKLQSLVGEENTDHDRRGRLSKVDSKNTLALDSGLSDSEVGERP